MKIAQCADSFLPIVDGVGRVVHQYATWLANAGHESYVITPLQATGFRGPYPFEIVDFLSVKLLSATQYLSGIATLDLHYLERISSISLDLVHVNDPGFSGQEGLRLAEKLKIPSVGTFHSKYYDDFLRLTGSDILATLGSRYVAEFYKRCTEVWTVSENAAETLHSYGYRGEIIILPNGTEMRRPAPEFEAAARATFHLGSEPILLYVGQLDFKKNLLRILEAATRLQQYGLPFQLVFAGQGQDQERLQETAAELGLQRVIFTGHIADRDVLDGLYMAAELFLFPSLYDTAGLVVREAAAMGAPSVVVEDSAPAEIIQHGENGFICPDSGEQFFRTIEHYLLHLSQSERSAIRQNVQASIPLPWEKIMPQVQARYQALLGF